MSQEYSQEDGRRGPKKGFGVEPSPLNGVKLELGIALFVGALLWLAVDSITADLAGQLLILGGYSLVAALWLVWRVRRTVRAAVSGDRGTHEA